MPVPTSVVRVATAFLAFAALRASAAHAETRLPNIVVIVVDTMRADRLGLNGNARGLTPFLDALGGRGAVFVNAYAPSSWTYPSIASLFTSRYASQHQVVSYDSVLPPDEVTLAELLAERGYLAAGFCANFRVNIARGYAQGFDHWESYLPEGGQAKPTAAKLRTQVLAWLASVPDTATRPLLLYLHYMEPHAPYEPAEPYRSRFAKLPAGFDAREANRKLVQIGGIRGLSPADIDALASLYDGAVAEVDAEIRTVMGELEQRGLLRDAIVIVTADHGEELGEHGALLHGTTLFQPAIRIPLIMLAPPLAGTQVVRENVSLIDLAPTLMDLIGVPAPPSFEGRSLRPLLRAQPGWREWLLGSAAQSEVREPTADVLSELEAFQGFDTRAHGRAFIRGMHKVLVARKGEASTYDLARDPGEHTPRAVAPDGSDPDATLLRTLEERQADLRGRRAAHAHSQPLDDATKEKLRALGYKP